MRENFEHGLYKDEEYQYWQKVNTLKEKLALLDRVPDSAINRAAHTLLDLSETWENTTQEERKDLVHVMIQEVGVDVAAKRVLWVKARPDYEPLFTILDRLHPDAERRYWLEESLETQEDNRDIAADPGQVSTGVKTSPVNVPQCLDKRRGVCKMRIMHFKNEIAQRELNDLCRKPSVG